MSSWDPRLRVEPRADANADIRAIHAYTVRVHGKAQARRYLTELRARMKAIAANPGIGRIYPEATPETSRVTYGQHFIYHRVEGDVLLIVRVLHQRMLQEGRLT